MQLWVICPLEGHLIRVQSVRALVAYFAKLPGFRVTIFGPDIDASILTDILPSGAKYVSLGAKGTSWVSRVGGSLWHWRRVLQRYKRNLGVDHIVAVDRWGLVLAALVASDLGARTSYFNLELRVNCETKHRSRRAFNKLEAFIHRRTAFTIIQDQWREECIRKEHNLCPARNVMHLPNSPAGASKCDSNLEVKTRFSFRPGRVTLLYVGSIVEHFMVIELVTIVSHMSNVDLIVHSPASRLDGELREKIKEISSRGANIHLSEELLAEAELSRLISGCDIGVALVRPVEGNYINEVLMGFSGGKMMSYLQHGIPMITTDMPSLRWVEDSGCGVCLSEVSRESMGKAIDTLMSDRPAFSTRGRNFFDGKLRTDMYLDRIRERIVQLLEPRPGCVRSGRATPR